jgi:hypothetical protein
VIFIGRLDHPNTLAGARKLAGEAALLVAKGIDPAKRSPHQTNDPNQHPDQTAGHQHVGR